MRKSLVVYVLLLPFLLASSLRIAAAMSEAGSSSPWNNPVATASEIVDEEYGVSIDNLITVAPFFDSVTSYVAPILKLVYGNPRGANRHEPPSLITLHRKLRI